MSIDLTLVFNFNYKLDLDGVIYDKQIHVTTTTFDIGEVINTMSDSFGWYQVPIIVSLKNIGGTKLDYASFRLKETFK
jgi:hypothetical protein